MQGISEEEKLLEFCTVEIFGQKVRFVNIRNTNWIVVNDIIYILGMSVSRINALHKKKKIKLGLKYIGSGFRQKLIRQNDFLKLLRLSDDKYANDLVDWLLVDVLSALAKDGEYIVDKEDHNPMIEILKNIENERRKQQRKREEQALE